METFLSVAALAAFLWVARVLVPRAVAGDDRFALLCALLAVLLAFLVWLLIGPVPLS